MSRVQYTMILLRNLTVSLLNRTPETSRVILNTNTTSHKMLFVIVSMRFRFTFAPPMTLGHNRYRMNACVVPFAFRTVGRRVISPLFDGTLTPPLYIRVNGIVIRQLIVRNMIGLMRGYTSNILILIFRHSTYTYTRQRQGMRIRATIQRCNSERKVC